MQGVFNYFIEQLNNNTSNLLYKGNYVFKFYQESMTVLEPVTGKLVNEELEFSPVSILTKQPIPFVESNKRVDWLVEFGILIRIRGQEYDATTDLDFANIESVLTTLQGASATITSKKYTFKTQPADYQGYVSIGKYKYAIISCTMNITEITYGNFGQESIISVDSSTLDWTSAIINTTKRFHTIDNKTTTANDYNKVIGRALVWEITFNYNGEIELLNEVRAKSTLTTTHTLKEVFGSTTFNYDVTFESGTEIMNKGGVKQLTIRLVER